MFSKTDQQRLLKLAMDAIRYYLQEGAPLRITPSEWPDTMLQPGASFVTLHLKGNLRGCIGTLEPNQPLIEDICDNAVGAAFRDPRFPALSHSEFEQIALSISILGAPLCIEFSHCNELESLLNPGIDGLILEAYGRRAVFLPQVWKSLPSPREFIRQLKLKARLSEDEEPPTLRAKRFQVHSFQ